MKTDNAKIQFTISPITWLKFFPLQKEKFGIKNVLTSIERGCASECEPHNIAYAHRVLCCEDNLCNAAQSLTMATCLIVMAAVFAMFMKL